MKKPKPKISPTAHYAALIVGIPPEGGRFVDVTDPICDCDAATELRLVLDAIATLLTISGGDGEIITLAHRLTKQDPAPTQAPAEA